MRVYSQTCRQMLEKVLARAVEDNLDIKSLSNGDFKGSSHRELFVAGTSVN